MKRTLRASLILVVLPACNEDSPATPMAPPAVSAPMTSPAPAPISTPTPPLTVSCRAVPRSGDAPLTVRFTAFPDGGTGSYDFAWRFGDGETSTQEHPTHTYASPGVYGAVVAVTSGDQVRECDRSITVGGTPPAPGPPGATPLTDLVITITGINGGMSYSPNPATAQVGQRVIWRNADGLPHTATADGGSFDTGLVNPGASSAAIAMGVAGAFPYHCTLHPGMVGTVTVTP